MLKVESGRDDQTNLELNRFQFIIKFMADGFSDNMAFPQELASTSKEVAKLDKKVDLVGPSGNRWEVKLSKRNGRFYLEDGWKEFIQDHYVMEGDCLVFKYCGDSCFTVLIFDKSGCERESSYFVKNQRNPASNKVLQAHQKYISLSSDDDNSFVRLHSPEISHSKRKTRHDQSLKPPKHEKGCINLHDSKFSSCLKTETKKAEMKIDSSKTEARALRLFKSISKRNPCFTKVLPASSMKAKYGLEIPRHFVVNCKLFKQQLTTLEIPRKNKWAVEYVYRNASWFLLWKTFVEDNGLKAGDACVFELVEYRPKMVMIVHIFRAS